jgi:DNA polymerase-3 subunit epsilon
MALVALDFETTGFSAKTDRVLEVGAVLFTRDGKIIAEYQTLVNPKSTVRASHVHGISASDVIGAPEFVEVLPSLVDFLNGNVLVAHNKSFDLSFFAYELHRAGIEQPKLDALCTLDLVGHVEPAAPGKLLDSCKWLGIPLRQGHHALNDAHMTAQLAAHLLRKAKNLRLPDPTQISLPPSVRQRSRPLVSRDAAFSNAIECGRELADLVAQLPAKDLPNSSGLEAYFQALGKMTTPQSISSAMAQSLIQAAKDSGLSKKSVQKAHKDFLTARCAKAMDHHFISERERAEFKSIALFLGVDGWEAIVDAPTEIRVWKQGVPRIAETQKAVTKGNFFKTEQATDFSDRAERERFLGWRFVITGNSEEYSREQATEAITKRGGRVIDKVYSNTSALIAGQDAGPRKVQQAKDLGIPILNAAEFRTLLDTGEFPDRYG